MSVEMDGGANERSVKMDLHELGLSFIEAGKWSEFYQKRGDFSMYALYHGIYMKKKSEYFQHRNAQYASGTSETICCTGGWERSVRCKH